MIPTISGGGKFPRHLISGLFVIIVGVLGAPTTALAQAIHLPPIQFVAAISGPCVFSDVITLSGQIDTIVYIRPDGSGGTHVTVRTVMKGQGTTADLVVTPKKYVVNSEDKRRARINMIAHLLSTVPYHEVEHSHIEMPKRPPPQGYLRPAKDTQTWVPDYAATLLEQSR